MGRGGPFRRDRQARHQGLAVDFQGVRPQVERRTVEQGGLFGLVEARSRHGLGQPRGQHPALRHRLSGHDRRRAIGRPVEQPRQRAIGLRQTQHGRPARGGISPQARIAAHASSRIARRSFEPTKRRWRNHSAARRSAEAPHAPQR
jgi:hypothetical protein